MIEREKGGDIRAPISRFLSVKLGLFLGLVGTKRGGDQRWNRWERRLIFLLIIDNDHKIFGDGGDSVTDTIPDF